MSAELFASSVAELLAFAQLRRAMSALDVACGPGMVTRAAAQKLGADGKITGVDFAAGMIEQASAAANAPRDAKITWAVMDAHKLEFPNGTFDAVLCSLGLMLFADPQSALNEMRRVARPGATVACMVQGRRSHMMFTSLVLDAIVARAPQLRAPKGAPTLYAFGSDGVLETSFMQAGLIEISTKRISGVFKFSSAEEYWNTMVEGAGRTRQMLESLTPEVRAKVQADVLRRAARRKSGRAVQIPYEFVLARGHVPA